MDVAIWGQRAGGVSALERQLAGLRRDRSDRSRDQGLTIARAAVLNIVVYATRDAHARRAARTIAQLALRHPSRAIVIHADARRGPDGGSGIEMHCRLPEAGTASNVVYEQILIRARGDVADRLVTAVIPLLLPDLPVFLWWTGTPPIDGRVFEDLVSLADRLIIDSADVARPDLALPVMSRALIGGRGRYGVTDFNWTRLTPWRELVASFFDIPQWRPSLERLVGVRVGFAVDADGRDIHPSQALLLIGWLASRLGWREAGALAPSEAGGLLFQMERPDGRRIDLRVRPRFERGISEGDLSGVRLQGEDDRGLVEFVIKREPGARHASARIEVAGAVVASRTVPLSAPSVTDLLGEELTIVASDRIYEEALGALVALG